MPHLILCVLRKELQRTRSGGYKAGQISAIWILARDLGTESNSQTSNPPAAARLRARLAAFSSSGRFFVHRTKKPPLEEGASGLTLVVYFFTTA